MPLREIVLLLIVGGACCAALVKPRIGLYAYIWFALLRPDVLAWCADKYPFSLALALTTLLGAVRYMAAAPAMLRSPISRWLLLLQAPLAASTLFAVAPDLSYGLYYSYARSLLMALLIPLLIENEKHLRELLYVISFSLGLLGAKMGLYGILHGGVDYSGQSWGSQHDNNLLTLGLVMVLPICWYCRRLVRPRAFRLVEVMFVLGVVATAVMSGSRGSMLAMGVVMLVMLYHCRRRLAGLVAFTIMLGGSIWFVEEKFVERLSTLERYEEDASARARIDHALTAVEMWQDYPLLGVGFGGRNYAALAGSYLGHENIHVVHNGYLQMLVDSGITAFLIYTGLLFGSILWLGRTAKHVGQQAPGLETVPRALQGALIVFAVGSCFYSVQRYDFLYFLLMSAAAWHNVLLNARARAVYSPRSSSIPRHVSDALAGAGVPQPANAAPSAA